jgi:hypothetical protein
MLRPFKVLSNACNIFTRFCFFLCVRAHQFLSTMRQGFPDYNVYISKDKILTNFSPQQSTSKVVTNEEMVTCADSQTSTHPGDPFPWCGLLIHPENLEVSVDYSRYCGLRVKDTATFDISCRQVHVVCLAGICPSGQSDR